MIATLKEKASHEKDSLTKMLSDCKQQLENAKAIEKREEKVRQSRDDASIIQHLQKLNIHVNTIQYVYIVIHVRTSSCMFQSADQHQSHLLTWGCI
jgi:DNA invertase Pin-like site-specific DNA recombinase